MAASGKKEVGGADTAEKQVAFIRNSMSKHTTACKKTEKKKPNGIVCARNWPPGWDKNTQQAPLSLSLSWTGCFGRLSLRSLISMSLGQV